MKNFNKRKKSDKNFIDKNARFSKTKGKLLKSDFTVKKVDEYKSMSRFKLYIEYEGTRFGGWQKQKNQKSVQGTLISAGEKIFNTINIDIQGSGRTDKGVHALCQIAHLDVQTMLAPEIIRMKFNDILPHDINILEVEKVHRNFHARHDTVERSYLYQISRRRSAFVKPFVWWIKDKLNINNIKTASELLIGMNDFVSFTDDLPEEKSTLVKIENVEVAECGDLILIRITGSHFLWKMVRRIIGVLVEIGRGKMKKEDLIFYLNNISNEPAKFTAPPSGLFLEQVLYKDDIRKTELIPVTPIENTFSKKNKRK